MISLPQKTETVKKEEPTKKEEMKIEDLPGVGPKTAERLREAGIAVIEEVAVAIPEDLMEIGVTHDQAKKIIDSARSQINKFGIIFKTAKDILKEIGPSQYLTSGVPSLDRILGGGFETKKISEIWGSFGSGKTQLALQLAVTAQLPTAKGGLNTPSLVIDTEGTFHHNRVASIAKRFELDPEKVLSNIILSQAYNSDHQVTLLNHANEVIKERGIRLIIIDSLTAHFRSEYIGREMLASRQQELNRHRNRLLKLCRIFNAVGIVTTQAIGNPAGGGFAGPSMTPVGGHCLHHGVQTILNIWKPHGQMVEKRFITIEKSSYLQEQKIEVKLTEGGFTDPTA